MKIKVMMDYCADPVWDCETGFNLDISTIHMSDKLKDKFESFRKYWEFVHRDFEREIPLHELRKIDKMAEDCAFSLLWEGYLGGVSYYSEVREELYETFLGG